MLRGGALQSPARSRPHGSNSSCTSPSSSGAQTLCLSRACHTSVPAATSLFTCQMWTRAVLCAGLLCALWRVGRTETERQERDALDLRYSNRLLGDLQEVLEKLQTKRISPWEKKYGQVPSCDLGEHCAVRKGSRIGRMCDCPQGAFCNFFLLKCL